LRQASDARARHAAKSGGRRRVCVDLSNQYALASRELIEAWRPDDMQPATPLVVSNDVDPLLSLLPVDLVVGLDGLTLQLSDIVLDKGRRPQAWCSGKRIFLGADDRKVAAQDLDDIVSRIGGFGSDNRAGLHEQLHRISAIRNRADAIIGLTMRVGRHVSGNAAMIADLLFHDDASILFLGEPGSGKTTVVREVTRLLAERSNVLIVDTSNEIAGDGDVPHPCVGHARRMQVRSLEEQGGVMIEGVQNHTPEVMVIDEIGRPPEVEAARTVKQRGVRIIASAHGDLRKLLKNKQLRGLIGGVELVTLGDAQAKEEARKRGSHPSSSIDKLKAQRAGPPVFDIIVELRRGEPNEWRVVNPCAKAVDMILEGSHYLSRRRTRDPATGDFFLELEKA
jgi:stage III sporulation protein SpoIIIAA